MVEPAAEPNFIATLGLNWKLFLAQLVNFTVVLLVLWKWVFKPVAGALEGRRQRIEESVKKAAEIESRLRALEESEAETIKETRIKAEKIIKQANDIATRSSLEIVAAARGDANKVMTETKAAILSEKEQMLREARQDLAELTVLATEKILRTKLDGKKDQELIAETIKHVK